MCHLLFGIRAQFTHVNDYGISRAVLVSQGAWEQEGLSWDICRRAASATAALVEAPGTLYQELVGSVGHVIVRVHFSGLEDSRTLNNTHTSWHTAHTHTCTCSHLLMYIPLCTLLYTHAHTQLTFHLFFYSLPLSHPHTPLTHSHTCYTPPPPPTHPVTVVSLSVFTWSDGVTVTLATESQLSTYKRTSHMTIT